MSDPIEDALSRMKPTEMSGDLMARLTSARSRLSNSEDAGKVARSNWSGWLFRWLAPAGVCAVAAFATVVWLDSGESPASQVASNPTPAHSAPVPFEMEERLVNARELGTISMPNQRPIRLMELEWIQSDTLRPAAGASGVRVETTRRQVVPVAIEVY